MQFPSRIRPVAGAFVAAVLLILTLAGCGEPPAPGSSPASGNSPQGANANAAAPAGPKPQPGDAKPPLRMEDTVEGRVIGLICYKENPKASPEEAKACALDKVAKGGRLGILGADGTVYVDSTTDAGVTNQKLKDFIGEDVTIQGQMIGDVPDLNWADVKVKKFAFKLVRRKGAPPAGTPRQLEPKPKPTVPVKKP